MKHNSKKIFIAAILLLFFIFFKGSVYSKTDTIGIPVESNPRGIAINPATNQAVVANEMSGSVSITDLNTQAVISVVTVGKMPRGVAIDRGLSIALISNNNDNTVSILDLTARKVIATLPVGKSPEGIAVDSINHKAAVTNHRDNTVSFIDLMAYRVTATVKVGQEPIDAAIDPALNLALIVNEKDYNVSVIDLNTYQITGTVSVGKKPRAIDINPETRIAVVANEKDNSVTAIDLQTWQTNTITIGKHPVDIAINSLTNHAAVICDEDRTLLLIDLNTNTIIASYLLNKLPHGIAVNSFTSTAAVADDKTDSLTLIQLPILAENPPTINITSPINGATLNASPITVTGDVSNATIVKVNGIQAYMSNNTFSASIPLNEGQNTITATATDQYGRTASHSITVTLTTKGNITGTVTDSSTGLPISSASVSITDSLNNTQSVLTDSEGKYTINGISSGVFNGSITKGGYAPYNFTGAISHGQTIIINAALNPILPVINNVTVSNITNNSATITWTTDQPSDSIVEYGITQAYGSSVTDLTLTTNHSIVLTNLTPGTTYHFRVTSKNSYGFPSSSGDNTFTTISPIQITIISPTDGSTIYGPDVMAKGTIANPTGKETGVTVNGVIATVYGNEFIANNVLLQEGTNTVTVTATDTDGNKATKAITVNAVTTGNYIRLISNIDSGIAPLMVSFSVSTQTTHSITNYQIDFQGDGIIDYTGTTFENINHAYIVEGVFYPTLTVTDDQGNSYSDTIAITVLSKTQLDALLKGKWDGMKGALMTGDITTALSYISSATKIAYQEMFNALSSQLPLIVSTQTEVNLISIVNDVAKYELVNVENG
ncbi:MAG: carboxypeptidase regulatory-like domain-containing protein, partial [Nitrospirae bacterium]|nr:carboxypeptidase regulatory-like domain-containing protein [Nitrospirota bacterium]